STTRKRDLSDTGLRKSQRDWLFIEVRGKPLQGFSERRIAVWLNLGSPEPFLVSEVTVLFEPGGVQVRSHDHDDRVDRNHAHRRLIRVLAKGMLNFPGVSRAFQIRPHQFGDLFRIMLLACVVNQEVLVLWTIMDVADHPVANLDADLRPTPRRIARLFL